MKMLEFYVWTKPLLNRLYFIYSTGGLSVAEILEELEIFTLADVQKSGIDIYIIPPDEDGGITDGDSGDEDCNDPDRLSRRQLCAEGELVMQTTDLEARGPVTAIENPDETPQALDDLNNIFMINSPNESNISIDESMIPYFGRHGCKQFIRGKPIRFGFKAWVAAQYTGYCMQADIYQGRKVGEIRAPNMTLGESVVMKFVESLESEFPSVKFNYYFDNVFTCCNLLE